MGSAIGVLAAVYRSEYNCSWRHGIVGLRRGVRHRMGRGSSSYLERTITWWYYFVLPKRQYLGLLRVPAHAIGDWLPGHELHLQKRTQSLLPKLLDFFDACVFVQIIIKSILTAIGFVWSTRGKPLSLGSFVKSVMVTDGINF